MKRKIYSIVSILAIMLMVFSSCKKETVDVTDLLKSVPSSAAGVIVFNMEGMLNDAGCKIKDHEIIPGKEVTGIMEKLSATRKKDMMILFENNTGIEPKGALIFYDSNRSFLTFALYDVDKFCSFIENQRGSQFTDGGSGVRVCGNTAVKGAQAWVCLSSGKRIDADAIANYASLGTSQSFLVSPMGEELLTSEDDIRGWAMLNTFMNEMLSRRDRNMMTLGMGFMFENAESVKFSADFKKGEMEAEAIVLNDKSKPAKYLLPSDKVDVSTLKTLGTTCDAMMAFTLTPKLIKKFDQLGNALGGALFGDLGETFKNVDGTVGIVASGSEESQSINGVVTLKGDVSPTLKDMIATYMGPISIDGKLLKFSKGDVKGNLNVAECADELKGSCLGMVVDASGFNTAGFGENAPSGFGKFVVKMKPESGGLEIDFEMTTSDPNENALLTILKNMN